MYHVALIPNEFCCVQIAISRVRILADSIENARRHLVGSKIKVEALHSDLNGGWAP